MCVVVAAFVAFMDIKPFGELLDSSREFILAMIQCNKGRKVIGHLRTP